MALSLVYLNIELYRDGTTSIVDGQVRSVSVSPAITLVLYWMCGVSVEIFSYWKMHEVLCQLYQLRRMMLDLIKRDDKNMPSLENDLKLLGLMKLDRRVPEPKSTNNILIPYVDNGIIWMNKDLAPYADVVAPYSLYQSKYSKSKSPTVHLDIELKKCGLLNGDNGNNQVGWAITICSIATISHFA